MTRPIVIAGAGGHAAVVIDAARAAGHDVRGLVDSDPRRHGGDVLNAPVLGDDEIVFEQDPSDIFLVVGIGSTADTNLRRNVFEKFHARGYEFATIIHPKAVIGQACEIAQGAVIMAGAIVQPRCRIGENVIINTGAQIDHDCAIGAHAHIAPGAVLSGDVTVGAGAHIGVGATILQGRAIGSNAVCAGGAVVIGDVAENEKVAGNPARSIPQ